jgi:hypothetical protein
VRTAQKIARGAFPGSGRFAGTHAFLRFTRHWASLVTARAR